MDFELISIAPGLIHRHAVREIVNCNIFTERFGLRLTEEQAAELAQTRSLALQNHGRVEFGGGVIDKIIKEFCDSAYLSMNNYPQTLHELIDMFYYYKNDTMDLVNDDELIALMKAAFEGVCEGSLELLSDRELYRLAKNVRCGLPVEDDVWEDEEEYNE